MKTFKFASLTSVLLLASSSLLASLPEFPFVFCYDEPNPYTGAPARYRALGPLFEKRSYENPALSYLAVRPLFSRQDNPDNIKCTDIVWPLCAWRDSWHVDYSWHLLYFHSDDPNGNYRSYFFPLWFSGRDEEGFHWGVFPLYGDNRNFFSYDRSKFIVWPLYWHTEKNGKTGAAYFWPLVNMESGPRGDKFRALPFYAYNEVYERHYTQAFLWPIIMTAKSEDETVPGEGWMVWPFYGQTVAESRKSWSVLWPLITHSTRGDTGTSTHAPWPLVQYSRDYDHDGDYMLWLCPIWGHKVKADEDMYFILFPLGWYLEDRGEMKLTRWLWALPLYWTQSVYDKSGTKRESLYRRFFPFASYDLAGEDANLRILDLWPVRRTEPVERNLAPFWTLFDYEGKAKGWSWDCLWGFLRERSSSDGSEGKFSIAPFYASEWNAQAVKRDYFLGILSSKTPKAEASSYELFWLWDIENKPEPH